MDEKYAWNSFLQSGSVLDYLQYKAIQNEKDPYAGAISEDKNEVSDGRTDNKGTEYR